MPLIIVRQIENGPICTICENSDCYFKPHRMPHKLLYKILVSELFYYVVTQHSEFVTAAPQGLITDFFQLYYAVAAITVSCDVNCT